MRLTQHLPAMIALWLSMVTAQVHAQAANAPAAAPGTTPAASAAAASAASATAATEKTVELNRAAKVVLVEGDVAIFSAAKQKRSVKVGDVLVEGDSIVTGKDGDLHLDMEDGGYISVRPNTRMRIVKYQAKGEDSDTGVFGLLQGSFRSVTGWIGKFNRDKYTVRTPAATIGIRGTDHEPYVIPAGSSEGPPGTYDKVNEGGSVIRTASGKADVGPNQSGFVSHDKADKPRVLREIPAHFRAGRNDRLFAGKHAEVQARIEKRREERRGEIRQRLQQAKAAPRTARQQSLKEKREEARKAREDARKEKQDKKTAAKAEADAEKGEKNEKGEHIGKGLRKGHAVKP